MTPFDGASEEGGPDNWPCPLRAAARRGFGLASRNGGAVLVAAFVSADASDPGAPPGRKTPCQELAETEATPLARLPKSVAGSKKDRKVERREAARFANEARAAIGRALAKPRASAEP